MGLKLKALLRKNPQDQNAPGKYYATAVADGEVNFERLAALISYQSSVTESDCMAVLLGLEHNVIDELAQGRIVRVGCLGTFQISVSAIGANTAMEVNANSVVKSRILFRPGKRFKTMLLRLEFKKLG